MRPVVAALVAAALSGCEPPPGAPPRRHAEPAVDAGAPDLPPLAGAGTLRVIALDDETGQPMPARVVVTATGATRPHLFDLGGDGMSVAGAVGVTLGPGVIGAPEGVLLAAGDGGFALPAGTWDVAVYRGPEWERALAHVVIGDGAHAEVTAPLARTVDTRGWLAADLHVHTARSFDSMLQPADRVVSEVSVGVELIVTTDHNVFTDLQPEVEQLGYGGLARALVGDEFNFYEGHGGAYPVPYDATDPLGGGAAKWQLDLASVRYQHSTDLFQFLRTLPTRPAITINHPRLQPDLGYFINLKEFGPNGWAPPSPLPDVALFDAIELLNGYMNDPGSLALLLRDWFFLLDGGARVTALGSSDTHRLRDVKAGFPRTWLRMPTESPAEVAAADLADAIRAGRAIASNGPFALLTVENGQIGDLVGATGATVTVDALVDAPAWIDVAEVRVLVNGRVAQSFAVAPGLRPTFHQRFPLALPPGDAWVALQANGRAPLPPALIGEHQGGAVLPFVVTNPVFVDRDGDGAWRPAIAQPDPGPIEWLGPAPPPSPPPEYARPSPEDCEPPLWEEFSRL